MFHIPGFKPIFLLSLLSLAALTWVSCGTKKSEAGPPGAVEVTPGDDIQIRSMAVLSGIGDLGVPSQRSVMFALAQYGPNKGTMSRWAQASTVSEPEREAAPRPIR